MHNAALIMRKYITAKPVYDCQFRHDSFGRVRLFAVVVVAGIAGITFTAVSFYEVWKLVWHLCR